jgi:hypothetical protein
MLSWILNDVEMACLKCDIMDRVIAMFMNSYTQTLLRGKCPGGLLRTSSRPQEPGDGNSTCGTGKLCTLQR